MGTTLPWYNFTESIIKRKFNDLGSQVTNYSIDEDSKTVTITVEFTDFPELLEANDQLLRDLLTECTKAGYILIVNGKNVEQAAANVKLISAIA
jgi:hypothetical protein